MPKGTILAKVLSRTFGLAGPGPIWTCKKLTWTCRRDGAGSFRAEFPATDAMLALVSLKNTYLLFSVGGRDVFLGLVERIQTRMDRRGRQTAIITGRDQLGALAENTIGPLDLAYVYNAPSQILGASNVPNQTFSLSADGYDSTNRSYAKTFAGESALAALIRVAADLGEHFRAPTDGTLEVVWMQTDTPDAPIRLVSSGGPLLHQNEQVAIIEEIESDADGFEMTNAVYAYGSGNGGARLSLQYATLTLPAGYSYGSDSMGYYIQNDAQQILPSVRRAAWKSFNHLGITPDTYEMVPFADALTGSTTIVLAEAVPFAIASGTLLDLNGDGVDFVELSAGLSAGGNVLNVVATTFDVLTTDTLVYTDPVALEGAANVLAQAAVTWLQRVSDPDKMVAYSMTVRGLPDTVTVGMKIPVLSQAPGFAIDDDLIILEISRTADSKGRTPATLKVVPVDWFAPAEAANLAMQLEELQNYQAQSQPVSYASLTDAPPIPANFTDLADTFASYVGLGGYVVQVKVTEDGLEAVAGGGGGFTQEQIEDFAAAMLTGNSGRVQASYNDGAGTITLILDVSAADKILYSTAADTWSEAAITSFARSLIDDADAATMRSTLGITVYDQETAEDTTAGQLTGNSGRVQFSYNDTTGVLTAILDVSAADKILYSTGADAWAEADITSFGRSLIDDANAAAGRSTLGMTIYDQETVEDAIAATLTGNSGRVQASYNDTTGAITLILDVSAADKILYSTGADAWAEADITSFGRSLIDDAAASNARTTLGLVIGTNVQAQDATLQSIAGLGTAADKMLYTTGVDTWAEAAITSFIRGLLDDADAATARATLGITIYDAETMQDAIGTFWADSSSIDVTYNDAGNSISAAIIDEYVQDLVGAMLSDSATIDFTYTDVSGIFTASVIQAALDHGSIGGLTDNDHPGYLQANGSTADNGIQHYSADIADITSTQALTIDLTVAAARRTFITYVDFTGQSGSNNGFWAYASGRIIWQQGAGTITIRSVVWEHNSSGTDAIVVTTITDGIRITVDSTGFGGTLNQNHLVLRIIGTGASSIAINTAIA